MRRAVVILQHIKNETAGTLEDFMRAKAIPFRYVKLYRNERLPGDFKSIRAVIILGGPMNVYEVDRYRFLKKEKLFLKKAIQKNIPCLGICLGAQLLSDVLGGKVFKAPFPEGGWGRIALTSHGTSSGLFKKVGKKNFWVIQWHEDTFEIPKGALHLAKSELVANQAFGYHERIFGLQFHVEANSKMLSNWFKKSKDRDEILRKYRARRSAMNGTAKTIYQHFFSL